MSWPDDGEPRFIVRESTGYQRLDSHSERTEVMVLDRGYCHRVVWSSWRNLTAANYPLDRVRLMAGALAEALEVSHA